MIWVAASDSGRLQPLLNVFEQVIETELAKCITDSRKLIDYWVMDWGCKGDTSPDHWQCFRVKRIQRLIMESSTNTKGLENIR